MAKGQASVVQWRKLSGGPTLVYHAGCIVGNLLYVHGGITCKNERFPSNGFHRYDIDSDHWEKIGTAESPSLSHHACLVVDDRFIVLIGGWNGTQRVADVFVYDLSDVKWRCMAVTGFSDQGGLSSHSATPLRDGSVLVIGREGSLHMQRRYGNGFSLKLDFEKFSATYARVSRSLESRSGHTVEGVANSLYVIGGRGDKLVDVVSMRARRTAQCRLDVADKITAALKNATPLKKEPAGRRSHVSLALRDGVFIHGGETFDGRNHEPVGEMLYLRTNSLEWFSLGVSDVGLAGHVMCSTAERIYIHGGEGAKGSILGQTYKLVGVG